jgi:hypothetical protein
MHEVACVADVPSALCIHSCQKKVRVADYLRQPHEEIRHLVARAGSLVVAEGLWSKGLADVARAWRGCRVKADTRGAGRQKCECGVRPGETIDLSLPGNSNGISLSEIVQFQLFSE